jgi:ADP-heptose:LPS heptosyltransferase
LRKVHLLIANDSAPMHIAAAVGTRVLGLFGPTNVTRARPYGDGHTVLQSGISCSPCEARTCANHNRLECLTSIAVQQVVEAARAMVGHETEQKLAVLPHP